MGQPRTVDSETAVELVERQVASTPDALAIYDGRKALTYSELWRLSAEIGHAVVVAGGSPDIAVGICARRSVEQVAAVVGILRAGAGYLPLDPDYPASRLGLMIGGAAAPVVVGHPEYAQKLPPGCAFVSLSPVPATSPAGTALPPTADLSGSHLCYVLYTSGSTGGPKGVALEHAALANLLEWQIGDSDGGPGTRTLQYAPLSFDVSFVEIFSTLAAGGTLVCVDEERRRDPRLLWQTLRTETITRLFLPFIALHGLSLFAEEVDPGDVALREVITAGEQLQCNERIRRLFERLPRCRLVNQYGPTETHVVTRHSLDGPPAEWPLLPPIGDALPNVRLYVVDGDGIPVALGEEGELFVGGIAVARGYVGNDALTAERFSEEPGFGGRMYKTGDVVRVRPDGAVDFVGRVDAQVKIRGFRVEPGEVEAELLKDARVREAVVVVAGAEPSAKELVAFVTGDVAPEEAVGIRAALRAALPEFLVPARVEIVAELPRTSSGKVDRAALAAGRHVAAAPSPGGDASVAARAWQIVLKVFGRPVDPGCGFAEAGGDSVSAVRISAAVADELGRAVPISWILGSRSLRELTERIGDAPAVETPEPRAPSRVLPVSAPQRQILLEEAFDPVRDQLVLGGELVVEGPLDRGLLEEAFRLVVDRHSALRTRFYFEDGDFRQEILPHVDVAFSTEAAESDEALRAIRLRELRARFDLSRSTAPRVVIVSTGSDRHRALFVVHHIACDGWSLNLITDEVVELYNARAAGRPPRLDQSPPQCFEVAVPDEREAEAGRRYWERRLADPPPALALEGYAGGHIEGAHSVARFSFTLDPAAVEAARGLEARGPWTLFSIFLAAWMSQLARASATTDVCVAVPMGGRTSSSALRAVGMFANTVVVRTDVRDEPFDHLLRRVHDRLLEAHDHQSVPFAEVVRDVAPPRLSSRHPIAQVMMGFQPPPLGNLDLAGGAAARLVVDLGVAEITRLDLLLNFVDDGSRMTGWIDYDAARFGKDSVARLIRELERLIEDFGANPTRAAAAATPKRAASR